MRIKTGDTVAIIAGRDQFTTDKKGNKVRTTGRVLRVYPKTNRVLVEGVNIVIKHQAPSQANEKGGIIEKEAPIHVSNVALIDPKTKTPTRVGIKEVDGKKVRYAKKSGEVLDK
ncbi:MAG: 50S ribosomal protein L24 [Acholeplasmataceae bacterium]|jgi:large subunit ribosomal protein L24|nr:50S ribosomal protein L24 [Acholeplasmataceae bacterium]